MPVIGLLGGVASGKSFVADKLADLGAIVLDGDGAGHQVLRTSQVKQELQKRWGDHVFGPDGEVDRASVARIVFAEDAAAELAFLESVTHPRIGECLRQQIDEHYRSNPKQCFVLDAPVMLKAGWQKICDTIVFVECNREVRLQRALQRGWSEADFDAREAAQESLARKREIADVKIDNSGSLCETENQVRLFWQELTAKLD